MADYTGDDFYCDVALRGVQALDVLHDDPRVLAFRHTRPFWPVHVVVVTREHVDSLLTVGDDLAVHLLHVVQQVAADVVAAHGAAGVTTNLGDYQDSRHLHVHVHAGRPLRRA
ncbi:HIT domain-containing protein [Nocardioides mangrovicus]|uniref:HIT domain-containing protein n=1 Tax=Nocardioides mangrovicus TaxID=2478913 RepID=A0A3L8P243_9ACTN|nr:HIT domain-containing protein [Nocardioides mangrovicus]RLV48468.1 HIT domain-containing protein [Nocardioides mangrovicus]